MAGKKLQPSAEKVVEHLSSPYTKIDPILDHVGTKTDQEFDAAFLRAFKTAEAIIEEVHYEKRGVGDKAGDLKHHFADKIGHLKDGVGDKAGDLKHHLADKIGHLKDGVGDKAGDLKHHLADKIGHLSEPTVDDTADWLAALPEVIGGSHGDYNSDGRAHANGEFSSDDGGAEASFELSADLII